MGEAELSPEPADGAPAAAAPSGVAAPSRRRDTFASLELPQFRLLITGTAFSQVASWMEEVTRGWLVHDQLGGSAFQLGLLAFIRGISQLIMSPFAGVIVERVDRRTLASLTQVVPGMDALLIAVLITTGHIAIWQLYPLVSISGMTAAINVPARQVLLYDVVGGEHLTNAIALNSVTGNFSRTFSPAVGGAIIGIMGTGAAYYAQALFFLLATLATFSLRPMLHARPVRTPMFQSIREGLQYVRGDPTMTRLVLLNVVPTLLIYPYVSMMPVFAKDVLGRGSQGLGVLLAGVGIGSIPGGLIVAGMTESRWKGRVMGTAALFYMGMVTLFALSTTFYLSFALLVIAGIGWSMMVTLNQTLLQIHVGDDFRGRVLALYSMASGLTPFGNLAMGASADSIGVQASVAIFALTGFTFAGVLGLGSKRVRQL